MWRRKNSLERGLATMETNTAMAVDQLAERIRERMDNETGQQLAQTLTRLAERVDALDLSDQMQRSRREISKAAKKAGKQVEHSGKQIAAVSAQTVPNEPTGWITPSLLGFLCGFGAGFLIARSSRS